MKNKHKHFRGKWKFKKNKKKQTENTIHLVSTILKTCKQLDCKFNILFSLYY